MRITFTISLSPEVSTRLTSAANRLDVSRGAVVRMALQDWFGRHDPDPKDSKPEDSWAGLKLNLMMSPATGRRKKNRLDLPIEKPAEEPTPAPASEKPKS